MSKQAEEKLKSVIWPRRPGKLGFNSSLSRDDFDRLYLCQPRLEPDGPRVTFESYRDQHDDIDRFCRSLENIFSKMGEISNGQLFDCLFRVRRRLEDKARDLGCSGDVLIDFYNPDLMDRELIKWAIQKREKPVFIGIDLADGPDRTAKLTFTPPAPPAKVEIKAVIT